MEDAFQRQELGSLGKPNSQSLIPQTTDLRHLDTFPQDIVEDVQTEKVPFSHTIPGDVSNGGYSPL